MIELMSSAVLLGILWILASELGCRLGDWRNRQ